MQKWYVLVYYIAYLMNYDIPDCFPNAIGGKRHASWSKHFFLISFMTPTKNFGMVLIYDSIERHNYYVLCFSFFFQDANAGFD